MTAIRSLDGTALVAAAHVHDLSAQNAQLQRDLTSARIRNRQLFLAMRRALDAPKLLGQSFVDKMLTLTYSNGRVVQLQPTADYSEASTEYSMQWVELTPAPDTAKAIVVDALGDDDDLDALPFLGGMAVVS